jgi:glycosyltransferase involved in cell wall biosynthesis
MSLAGHAVPPTASTSVSRMRLAYVTDCWTPEASGVAVQAERIVRTLRERGHALDLVCPRDGRADAAALRRRWAGQRQQLVHIATFGPLGRAALQAAESLGVPASADFRRRWPVLPRWLQWPCSEPLRRRHLRLLHNRAARTFVPTSSLRVQLAAAGFERVEVLGRGVDAQQFRPARRSAALRAAWDADDDSLVMLYVGRLAADKHVELAVRAFEAVRYLRPATRKVVVGDGPLRARLQAAHRAAHFAGVQRDETLAQHYASADLLLLPNRGDGAAQAALEAQASGLAVVALDGTPLTSTAGVIGAAEEADFISAVARAAALAERGSALRLCAREAALGAGWDALLRRFEQQLELISEALPPMTTRAARMPAFCPSGLQAD